jgi:hypothetical protein
VAGRAAKILTPLKPNRYVLAALGPCATLLGASPGLVRKIAGAFTHEPEELEANASAGAKDLVARAFDGIDPARLIDHHVHMVGLGTNGSGAFVNAKTQDRLRLESLMYRIYMSAAGVRNANRADQEYVARLVRLARSIKFHGKYRLLAFDKYYNLDGSVKLDKTNFYMPNEFIFQLARDYPDIFLPAISVHPYRKDAIAELDKWAEQDAKYVKWLPNAMGMDPSSARINVFYRKMSEHKMILLTHAGEEQAVEAKGDQGLGNPLLLRRALDRGVRVIMAHAAGLGSCKDLDREDQPTTPCFDLFLRLMGERNYEGLLFGELSALLQFNRMPVPFSTLLARADLHHRLVNGSDYPLPAINILIHTRKLARSGFITTEERNYLNEIYDYNPLLFDFVLKRTVRHPQTKQRLPSSVFMANPGLEN